MNGKKTRSVAGERREAGGSEIKRILVPIDFSKTSIEALRHGEAFAEKFGASLILLHVVEKAPFIAGMEAVPTAISDKEVAEKAAVELKLLATRKLREEIKSEILVRRGKAYHEINDAAKEV